MSTACPGVWAGQRTGLSPHARRTARTARDAELLSAADGELTAARIAGLGYAVDLLSNVSWLRAREIHYWGDIDTHGFAMLDRLCARFPLVRSHLMDIATLRAHEALWSVEDAPHIGTLERLTPVEKALYDALRFDRMGRSVRLEQERISFGWLEQALKVLSVA